MKYTLTNACTECPFRKNRPGYLRRSRSIAHALIEGRPFFCHKTCSGVGNQVVGPNSQHCAGALIVLERMNMPTQAMRVAEKLGLYDRMKLKMQNPNVFKNLNQFIYHHEHHLPGVQGLVRRVVKEFERITDTVMTPEKKSSAIAYINNVLSPSKPIRSARHNVFHASRSWRPPPADSNSRTTTRSWQNSKA
jgi:hypothetical protein